MTIPRTAAIAKANKIFHVSNLAQEEIINQRQLTVLL